MLSGKTSESRTEWIRTAISQLYPTQLSYIKDTSVHHYFGPRAYLNTCRVDIAWKATPARRSSVPSPQPEPTGCRETFDILPCATTSRDITTSQHILAYIDTKRVDRAPCQGPAGGGPGEHRRVVLVIQMRDIYPYSGPQLVRRPESNVVTPPYPPSGQLSVPLSTPSLGYQPISDTPRNTYGVIRDSTPVKELNTLYYKPSACVKANEDSIHPFLAGVILALAQRPFYGKAIPPVTKRPYSSVVSPSFTAEFHDVVVHILTISNKDFVVYKGVVAEALLRKFSYPAENPQPTGKADGMRIEYTRVPIWPILGLRERLGKALGPDLVGNVDEDNIETRGMNVESNDGTPKRRRGKE
ncbi:hypothetical protein LY78DRAFT_664769 [Colletotrichum sublineola]|nr:hypothetical protein LY78DRAFT_664769 [Colletotrichum sublineola]